MAVSLIVEDIIKKVKNIFQKIYGHVWERKTLQWKKISPKKSDRNI